MSGRAVIYVRVSSSRQIDNTSLEQQENACLEWCRQRGVSVDRVFVEAGESAKTTKRTSFQQMFTYLESERGSITHLVVDKIDRFGRSVLEDAVYRIKLKLWGVTFSSAKENIDDSLQGHLLANMLHGFAEYDNEARSQRALSGMKATLKGGRWTWKGSLGYLNGERGGPSLVHDPKCASLIALFFERVAEGHSLQSAVEWITVRGLRTAKGHKLSTSTASRLLRSPLYKGTIESKKWGISIDDAFPPITSPATWAKVQNTLSGRAITAVPHRKANPSFELKDVLVCAECGKPATASRSKGRSAAYAYYHCHRGPRHFRIRADKAEVEFLVLLESLVPNSRRMGLVEAVFRDVWEQRNGTQRLESEALEAELNRLTSRKRRLLEQMQDGVLFGVDFKELYDAVNVDIAKAESALASLQGTELDVDMALSYLSHLLWNLPKLFKASGLDAKQRIYKAIFPKGIRCSNTGFGTPVTHSLYSMLADETVSTEHLASPTGFEPVLSP